MVPKIVKIWSAELIGGLYLQFVDTFFYFVVMGGIVHDLKWFMYVVI